MASIMTSLLALSLGFLCYILVAMVAIGLPITLREQIGRFYLKLAARALKQWTFVRRVLSGYDVKRINVDEEQKLLKVTLTSPMLGDDNEYRFEDPDNRIMRLMNKPVALSFELIPAALDAELSEEGYHTGEKATNEGLWDGDHETAPDEVVVDPFVRMTDDLRLIDPIDVLNLVTNDVDPENIKSAEEKTKQRFSKYGGAVSPMELAGGAMGFIVGMGGILGIQYFQSEILSESSGGMPQGPTMPMHVADVALDAVVMLA